MDSKQSLPDSLTDTSPVATISPPPPPLDAPPAYTSTSTPPTRSPAPSSSPIPPSPIQNLNYTLYQPPSSTLSPDGTTLTIAQPTLSTSPSNLLSFLRQQASLPPRPILHILGTHPTTSSTSAVRTDFHLKLSLFPYIHNPSSTHQSWTYLSLLPSSAQGYRGSTLPTPSAPSSNSSKSPTTLESWCKAYTRDSSTLKTFLLEREVTNLDLDTLAGMIRVYFALLKYRGVLEIFLTNEFEKVKIQAGGSGVGGGWLRPLFKAVAGEKKWEVVKAVWPFASVMGEGQGEGEGRREFLVCSEGEWWESWRRAVGRAAVEGRKGFVGSEDWVEGEMRGEVVVGKCREWGRETGWGEEEWRREWGWEGK